jgi:hypothetical protein
MREIFEKSKADLRKEGDLALRGVRRFYELLDGASVTPQTIREDYGIEFNLDAHIKNVEKSPLKTSAPPPVPEWTHPAPTDEAYSDIEALAKVSTRPRTTLEGGSAEVSRSV